MQHLDHVLLTRFNLPSGGREARIRAGEDWLRRRWGLFERYCAPSVAAQTVPMRWIVYLDPESPAWLGESLAPYVSSGLLLPIHRAEVPPEALRSDLLRVTGGAPVLVTTNLDNDDALAVDFGQRVRAAVTEEKRRALYFTRGLIRTDDRAYERTDRVNAFCSVVEPADAPLTCWVDWHNRLSRHMPVQEVTGAPAWLQVVHGSNVSNRVRGRLTSPGPWVDLFPQALDDVPRPAVGELALERLLAGPARSVRDSTRTVLRTAAVAFLGKDGLHRVTERVHDAGRRSGTSVRTPA